MTVVSEHAAHDERAVVEIKAAAFTLPMVCVLHADPAVVATGVEEKIRQASAFFRRAPVVIDLAGLSEHEAEHFDLARLIDMLRQLELIPVGVRGGSAVQQELARQLGLAALGEQVRPPRSALPRGVTPAPREIPRNAGEPGSLLIVRPVRSGQKIYAPGDLTVLAPVNSGAELMADGSIHVYAPLRGRVFAGIRGQRQARIFCQNLQAELVAIAGHYRVSENIPAEFKGARVQIYLERDVLKIEPL